MAGCRLNSITNNYNMASSAGFTMMESIIAIAITAIVAGAMTIIISSSFKGASSVAASMDSTRELLYIDRLIRERAENLYVPYWASMELVANSFTDQLWLSNIGKYIESTTLICNSEKIIRGIEVRYKIGNDTFTTLALFSSKPLLKER